MEFDDRIRLETSLNTIFRHDQFEQKYCGDDILLKQVIDELDLYLNWLANLKTKYNIRKEYSLEHIAEQIFFKYVTKDNFKYHIAAMYISVNEIQKNLNDLYDELLENDKDYAEKITISEPKYSNIIKGQLALLNDLIIDFNENYWKIEEYFFQRPQRRKSVKSRVLMGMEIYQASIDALYRVPNYKTISYNTVSIFLLRQAIEVTILRAFGIICFLDKNNTEQKIKFDKILDFIENNSQYIEFPISKSLLKKIMNWSNIYIHKGFMHFNWEIIIAQNVLSALFRGGKDEKQWSIFGSIKINRNFYENNMEKELINFLFENNADNIRLVKYKDPECLLTDKTFV